MTKLHFEFLKDYDHKWFQETSFREIKIVDLLTHNEGSAASNKSPAWLLDLDSTLLCVSFRIQNIFLEFLRFHRSPPQHWQWLLPRIGPTTLHYDIRRTFREQFGLLDRHTAESRAIALWTEFEPFWRVHFFSERHLYKDRAYPGAVEFVNSLHQAGMSVVYLTARDRPRCGSGTVASIKTVGFPWNDQTSLLMKHNHNESDLGFKKRAAESTKSQFNVLGVIDNEPENLVMFEEIFPDAKIVFFHSVMSERIPSRKFSHPLLKLDSYIK